MIVLILFAFIAGIVTVLSPCILPILPIVLSSAVGGKGRPLGVTLGFIISFTLLTLFLSSIVRLSGLSANTVRYFSMLVLIGFGVSLLVPQFQLVLERLFGALAECDFFLTSDAKLLKLTYFGKARIVNTL